MSRRSVDFGPGFLADDDTDLGVLLYGGVELFFANIPNLGVSGELQFTSLGGVTFTAAGHWYFW